jgi:L-arabinose isomerase
MVFDCGAGAAFVASLVDMGNRFRLIVNGIECVIIDKDTKLHAFRNELRWNDIAWRLK